MSVWRLALAARRLRSRPWASGKAPRRRRRRRARPVRRRCRRSDCRRRRRHPRSASAAWRSASSPRTSASRTRPLLAEIVALGATHVALVVPLYQTDGASTELHARHALLPHPRHRRRDGARRPPRRARGDDLPHRAPLGAAPRRVARHAGAARSRRLVPQLRRHAGRSRRRRRDDGRQAARGRQRAVDARRRFSRRWRPLLERVRAVFGGKLVYSANWDHYQNVALFELVDEDGISGYFNLREAKRPRRRRHGRGRLAARAAGARGLARGAHEPLHLHRARLPLARRRDGRPLGRGHRAASPIPTSSAAASPPSAAPGPAPRPSTASTSGTGTATAAPRRRLHAARQAGRARGPRAAREPLTLGGGVYRAAAPIIRAVTSAPTEVKAASGIVEIHRPDLPGAVPTAGEDDRNWPALAGITDVTSAFGSTPLRGPRSAELVDDAQDRQDIEVVEGVTPLAPGLGLGEGGALGRRRGGLARGDRRQAPAGVATDRSPPHASPRPPGRRRIPTRTSVASLRCRARCPS